MRLSGLLKCEPKTEASRCESRALTVTAITTSSCHCDTSSWALHFKIYFNNRTIVYCNIKEKKKQIGYNEVEADELRQQMVSH